MATEISPYFGILAAELGGQGDDALRTAKRYNQEGYENYIHLLKQFVGPAKAKVEWITEQLYDNSGDPLFEDGVFELETYAQITGRNPSLKTRPFDLELFWHEINSPPGVPPEHILGQSGILLENWMVTTVKGVTRSTLVECEVPAIYLLPEQTEARRLAEISWARLASTLNDFKAFSQYADILSAAADAYFNLYQTGGFSSVEFTTFLTHWAGSVFALHKLPNSWANLEGTAVATLGRHKIIPTVQIAHQLAVQFVSVRGNALRGLDAKEVKSVARRMTSPGELKMPIYTVRTFTELVTGNAMNPLETPLTFGQWFPCPIADINRGIHYDSRSCTVRIPVANSPTRFPVSLSTSVDFCGWFDWDGHLNQYGKESHDWIVNNGRRKALEDDDRNLYALFNHANWVNQVVPIIRERLLSEPAYNAWHSLPRRKTTRNRKTITRDQRVLKYASAHPDVVETVATKTWVKSATDSFVDVINGQASVTPDAFYNGIEFQAYLLVKNDSKLVTDAERAAKLQEILQIDSSFQNTLTGLFSGSAKAMPASQPIKAYASRVHELNEDAVSSQYAQSLEDLLVSVEWLQKGADDEQRAAIADLSARANALVKYWPEVPDQMARTLLNQLSPITKAISDPDDVIAKLQEAFNDNVLTIILGPPVVAALKRSAEKRQAARTKRKPGELVIEYDRAAIEEDLRLILVTKQAFQFLDKFHVPFPLRRHILRRVRFVTTPIITCRGGKETLGFCHQPLVVSTELSPDDRVLTTKTQTRFASIRFQKYAFHLTPHAHAHTYVGGASSGFVDLTKTPEECQLAFNDPQSGADLLIVFDGIQNKFNQNACDLFGYFDPKLVDMRQGSTEHTLHIWGMQALAQRLKIRHAKQGTEFSRENWGRFHRFQHSTVCFRSCFEGFDEMTGQIGIIKGACPLGSIYDSNTFTQIATGTGFGIDNRGTIAAGTQ